MAYPRNWLGVRLPGRGGVAILGAGAGAGAVGVALGEVLRAAGRSVTFLDSLSPETASDQRTVSWFGPLA
jgi:hypothetical protein